MYLSLVCNEICPLQIFTNLDLFSPLLEFGVSSPLLVFGLYTPTSCPFHSHGNLYVCNRQARSNPHHKDQFISNSQSAYGRKSTCAKMQICPSIRPAYLSQ